MYQTSGFGSSQTSDRFDSTDKSSKNSVWKKLFNPDYVQREEIEQMRQHEARRMDPKTIKLEAAYGSERQFIVTTRRTPLVVHDLMEEVQRVFKIPINQQVIFHKGSTISDYPGEYLENLGVDNNHPIRVTKDDELPYRSPRSGHVYPARTNSYPTTVNTGTSAGMLPQGAQYYYSDPASYLQEVAPQRVPEPNYTQGANDVLKVYARFGSEREYLHVQGKKPLMVYDLKLAVNRIFRIPIDRQKIVFKGYNVDEYQDEAPLEKFGLENNSPIDVWDKGSYQPDYTYSYPATTTTVVYPDQMSARIPPPPANLSPRWSNSGDSSTEVLKVEVQHGSDRHQVILKGENKNLTVADLQMEMERITAVPIRDQKMFFKAQELHQKPYTTLKECGIENNHVIKMVGEPSRVRYSNYFGRLNPAQIHPDHHQQQVYQSAGGVVQQVQPAYYSSGGGANPTYGYQYP